MGALPPRVAPATYGRLGVVFAQVRRDGMYPAGCFWRCEAPPFIHNITT